MLKDFINYLGNMTISLLNTSHINNMIYSQLCVTIKIHIALISIYCTKYDDIAQVKILN